jgi:hypothetical protein
MYVRRSAGNRHVTGLSDFCFRWSWWLRIPQSAAEVPLFASKVALLRHSTGAKRSPHNLMKMQKRFTFGRRRQGKGGAGWWLRIPMLEGGANIPMLCTTALPFEFALKARCRFTVYFRLRGRRLCFSNSHSKTHSIYVVVRRRVVVTISKKCR